MSRYLLDTGIAQDFINQRNGIRERADDVRHKGNRIGICTPVSGELWSGVEGSASRTRNLHSLRHALSLMFNMIEAGGLPEASGGTMEDISDGRLRHIVPKR